MCNSLNLFSRARVEPASFFFFPWTALAFWRGSSPQRWVRVCVVCEHALAGPVWLWERGEVLRPPPPLAGSCCPQQCQQPGARPCASAQAAVPLLAVAGPCCDARLAAAPRHRHLSLPAASRHDGDFCWRGKQVPEDSSVSKRSWTRSPSVATPVPALDSAAQGVTCVFTRPSFISSSL